LTLTSSLAGYTGAKSAVAACPSTSCERTLKPWRPSWPRSRTRVPGGSWSASQGWLNHVALIWPVASATSASVIASRRTRRTLTHRISPEIATSSSPKSCEIGSSCAAGS